MARTRVRYVDAPPRNDVYVGMLAMAAIAMVIGCVALAVESDEYDWSTEAKVVATPSLPSPTVPAPKAATPAGPAVTPPAGTNTTPPMNTPPPEGGAAQGTPKPADPIAPTAPAVASTPGAAPPAALPANLPVVDTSITTTGPRPGFNPNLPRK
jgi:hypothetical protein